MAAVIIRQKDLKRLGKKLLNEIFDFLHNEYILTEFKQMKKVQEKFLEKLAFNHINTLRRQYKITEEKREELVKPFLDTLFKTDENSSDLEKSARDLFISNLVKKAMKNDGVDTQGIYLTLISLNLDMEIDEGLYYKTKAFLDIFRVFETAYSYLED